MLLEDKVAVVHGGGGSIGSAAARVFAREGARLFLAGRAPSIPARAEGAMSRSPSSTRWIKTLSTGKWTRWRMPRAASTSP